MLLRRFTRCCFGALLGVTCVLGASAALAAQSALAPVALSQLLPLDPNAAPSSPIVHDIRVEGTERIEPETVISYLTLAKGDAATPEKMDASLKALYATGLFADVSLAMDGSTFVVKIEENPIINRVIYEGNDAISKDDLEKEVQLKPRLVYTLPKVQKDVQRILDIYRREGRFAATVEPKIVKLEQNRVDLVFEITEGKRTGIRNIEFLGNTHFNDDRLQSVISTHESAWWRFFSTTDYYDPDRLNYDKELLHKFYQNEGYVDFRVLSAVAELTPGRDDFFITFTLEEGPRYRFGKIAIKSEIKGLDGEALRQYLTTHEGDWYDADQMEKSIAKLTTILGDMQYAFVNIIPDTDRHKDSLTVDLTYDIKESERVYVGRVNISGNTRTVDKVIRREIPLAEGDPFSSTGVHKAEQSLKDLNFFEQAKVTPVQGAQPDRTDLNVDLKEKSTGEVAVGAGYSSTDGPLGDFSISEHNFMGQGQDARIGATVSGRTDQIDTSFTEPHFLDRDLSAGADIFGIRSNNQDLSSYNVDTAGFNLRMGYPLSQQLRQSFTYSFHDDTISDVPDDASLYILDQQGTSVTSAIGQSLVYDTRDSKLNPTEGFTTHIDTDFAGVGGSRNYIRVKTGGTQYTPLAEKWILSSTLEAGEIWGLNGPTKINERFFLGGDTLRGFQYSGIGPRDLTSDYQDALGGTRYVRGTLQLTLPSPVPDELGLSPHIFTDAGVLSGADEQAIAGDTFATDGTLHVSAGVGIVWQSPFGPVGLDFAEPILYKSYDQIQHINFNFGTKF